MSIHDFFKENNKRCFSFTAVDIDFFSFYTFFCETVSQFYDKDIIKISGSFDVEYLERDDIND